MTAVPPVFHLGILCPADRESAWRTAVTHVAALPEYASVQWSVHTTACDPAPLTDVDALVIDEHANVSGAIATSTCASVLEAGVVPRSRVFVHLPDAPDAPYLAFALGCLHVGGVLRGSKAPAEVLTSVLSARMQRKRGKVALCLAGGGIEGLFWEIGVLRALDEVLYPRSLVDFDIFCGISAGAVLAAFAANGVRPEEIADALHGRPSRVDPITRTMLFDPNIGELMRRFAASLGDALRGKWITNPFDSALRVTPTAVFSGDKLRRYLDKQFTKPGMSNDFRTLSKRLVIGVTDQDTGNHVHLGLPPMDEIPLSQAVRASTAMTPYYDPEKIGERYYVDGIFTKTIDLEIAVSLGATLIIGVDPLRPVDSGEAGYVSGKGGVFTTVQSVKSMIRTRLSESLTKAETLFPDVDLFLFSPSAKDMEYMSGTMMRFFYRAGTESRAYDSAMEQLTADDARLSRALRRHGFSLQSQRPTPRP